jgi:hypothetical protein
MAVIPPLCQDEGNSNYNEGLRNQTQSEVQIYVNIKDVFRLKIFSSIRITVVFSFLREQRRENH